MSALKINEMLQSDNPKHIDFVRKFAYENNDQELIEKANKRHIELWLKGIFRIESSFNIEEQLLMKWKKDLQ